MMSENEVDQLREQYTQFANTLAKLSLCLSTLTKTIHKLEGLAALIDLQIEALRPQNGNRAMELLPGTGADMEFVELGDDGKTFIETEDDGKA